MSANDPRTSASSSSRVQEFRHRLADNFSRVEGYVLTAENAEIARVMKEQGVSKDVAVAGLVRLGLSAYRAATPAEQPTQHSPLARTASAGLLRGIGTEVMAGAASSLNSAVMANSVSFAMPTTTPSEPPSPAALSKFFRSRREILDDHEPK